MLDTALTRPKTALTSNRLEQELQKAGLRALLIDTPAGPSAGGLCASLDLRQQTSSDVDVVLAACNQYLQHGVPVTLSISGLAAARGADSCEASLGLLCEHIAGVLDSSCLASGLLGTSLQSHQLPLKAYQLICQSVLGEGPRYVVVDSLQMRQHMNPAVQQETDNNWLSMWQQRGSGAPLLPVYAASVRSACPLLGDEKTCAVLPTFGVSVPHNSAWLPVQLHLPNFSNGRGVLQWPLLQEALKKCVHLANQLLDVLVWQTDRQAADAYQNRRLAIQVTGIGDLVAESGADPGELPCLRHICDAILQLRRTLWRLSGELAQQNEPLPALLHSGPSAPWHNSSHRQHWRSRWLAALRATAVRNRNLLVLSPYSVLPADTQGAAEYADLLPVLQFADAWSFAEAPLFDGWSASNFRRFHQRGWATIQRQNGTAFVAAGV